MSGKLPEWNRLLVGKPAGYKTSAHLNDGKEIGKDLSGGFYDAGGEGSLEISKGIRKAIGKISKGISKSILVILDGPVMQEVRVSW
jgi:hypothetical protein